MGGIIEAVIRFFSLYLGSLVVGALVAGGIVATVIKLVRNRRKGVCGGCDCGCSAQGSGCGCCPSVSSLSGKASEDSSNH
ncbi:MAG: hypothetical protein LBD25_06795 [Coriobacteriales bacterium]|jgi:hypothetical protein|nr:hypothetical protein [Coriobacteriales bacterium]